MEPSSFSRKFIVLRPVHVRGSIPHRSGFKSKTPFTFPPFQGKHAEADLLFRRAMVVAETEPGTDHPSVAATLNNYAALLASQVTRVSIVIHVAVTFPGPSVQCRYFGAVINCDAHLLLLRVCMLKPSHCSSARWQSMKRRTALTTRTSLPT